MSGDVLASIWKCDCTQISSSWKDLHVLKRARHLSVTGCVSGAVEMSAVLCPWVCCPMREVC